jgi:hypothetical protein
MVLCKRIRMIINQKVQRTALYLEKQPPAKRCSAPHSNYNKKKQFSYSKSTFAFNFYLFSILLCKNKTTYYLCIALSNKVDYVAQLVEHLTFNQRVLGSNPSVITTKPRFVQISIRGFFI